MKEKESPPEEHDYPWERNLLDEKGLEFKAKLPKSWDILGRGLAIYCEFVKMTPNQVFTDRRATFRSEDLAVQRKHENLYKDFIGWLGTQKNKWGNPFSANTKATFCTGVRDFYSNIIYAQLIKPEQVETAHKEVRTSIAPSMEQVGDLLKEVDDLVVKAAVLGAVGSGMDCETLLPLKWTDGSPDFGTIREQLDNDGPIHIRTTRGKTDIRFQTFLSSATKKVLANIDYPKDELVFPIKYWNFNHLVKQASTRAGKKAKIPWHTTPHRFRATFNSKLKLAKVDNDLTEYLLAHALSKVKAAYLEADAKGLREMYIKDIEPLVTPKI